MITGATLFSGFEGVGVGMKQAGIRHLWGIEHDEKIARVAHDNGFNTVVANVLQVNPSRMVSPDVLHASPPCPNFSVAKAGRMETQLDIDLASKVAEFVSLLKPKIFTLENVIAYRNSRSWGIIQDALFANGYFVSIDHVNSADYGVPQTRKRMIARGIRDSLLPELPQKQGWIGWYGAIEDLIPGLPETTLSNWQLKRLNAILTETVLIDGSNGNNYAGKNPSLTIRKMGYPCNTIRSDRTSSHRAYLHDTGKIVLLGSREMARFQAFPDWYKLPASKTLAQRGIGNAVPPLLYEKIIRGMLEC